VRAWWLTGDRVVTKTSAAALSPNGARLGAGGIILMQSAGDQRIYILGAGAMGCLVGASLVKTFGREQVILIDVDEAHVRAIRDRGLRVFTKGRPHTGVETLSISAATPNGIRKADMEHVILATKAYSNAEALAGLRRDTSLLVLQNGYDERLDPFRNAVYGVENGFSCQVTEPGCIFSAARGRFVLGVRTGLDLRATEWAARLNKAGIAATVTCEIDGWLWGRLLIASAFGPATVLRRSLPREAIACRQTRRLVKGLLAEGLMIVQRKLGEIGQKLRGLPVPPPAMNLALPSEVLSRAVLWILADGACETAMLQDVCRDRPTEIDYINGAIVRLAARYGLRVPQHERICTQIRMLRPPEKTFAAARTLRAKYYSPRLVLSGVADSDLDRGDRR